eukprot:3281788-Prymnesium_polylepis.1
MARGQEGSRRGRGRGSWTATWGACAHAWVVLQYSQGSSLREILLQGPVLVCSVPGWLRNFVRFQLKLCTEKLNHSSFKVSSFV